jgi:uncharacterized membrane protein YhaH (DUF805 family)
VSPGRDGKAHYVGTLNSWAGRWASLAVSVVGALYGVALIVGFTTRGLSAPIVDPLLAIMEVLTMIAAPLLLILMAAIHGRASHDRRIAGVVALTCMALATGITSVVHFVELTAMRQLGSASLVWPSPLYAAELLAWDVFVGFSLVAASFTLENDGRAHRVRSGLLICGVLCLLGGVGPAVGSMRLQLVGVFGYGAVLPVVCLGISHLFRGDPRR